MHLEGINKFKESDDHIGNENRGFPDFNIAPQLATMPQREYIHTGRRCNMIHTDNVLNM
jgi:hypothetical protein